MFYERVLYKLNYQRFYVHIFEFSLLNVLSGVLGARLGRVVFSFNRFIVYKFHNKNELKLRSVKT